MLLFGIKTVLLLFTSTLVLLSVPMVEGQQQLLKQEKEGNLRRSRQNTAIGGYSMLPENGLVSFIYTKAAAVATAAAMTLSTTTTTNNNNSGTTKQTPIDLTTTSTDTVVTLSAKNTLEPVSLETAGKFAILPKTDTTTTNSTTASSIRRWQDCCRHQTYQQWQKNQNWWKRP